MRSEGCRPVVSSSRSAGVAAAFKDGQEVVRPVKPSTIAKSLAIGNPADGPYAVELAQKTNGVIESVSDDEIRAGIRLLAETTGIFTETAGGVTIGVPFRPMIMSFVRLYFFIVYTLPQAERQRTRKRLRKLHRIPPMKAGRTRTRAGRSGPAPQRRRLSGPRRPQPGGRAGPP